MNREPGRDRVDHGSNAKPFRIGSSGADVRASMRSGGGGPLLATTCDPVNCRDTMEYMDTLRAALSGKQEH